MFPFKNCLSIIIYLFGFILCNLFLWNHTFYKSDNSEISGPSVSLSPSSCTTHTRALSEGGLLLESLLFCFLIHYTGKLKHIYFYLFYSYSKHQYWETLTITLGEPRGKQEGNKWETPRKQLHQVTYLHTHTHTLSHSHTTCWPDYLPPL